jgi:hypothetical protein
VSGVLARQPNSLSRRASSNLRGMPSGLPVSKAMRPPIHYDGADDQQVVMQDRASAVGLDAANGCGRDDHVGTQSQHSGLDGSLRAQIQRRSIDAPDLAIHSREPFLDRGTDQPV